MVVNLWTVRHEDWSLYIEHEGRPTIEICEESPEDVRFARALCHILNNTSVHRFDFTDEELDMEGCPKND